LTPKEDGVVEETLIISQEDLLGELPYPEGYGLYFLGLIQ